MTATDPARCESSLFPVLLEHAAQYSDLDPSRRIGRDTLVRWFEDARVQLGRHRIAASEAPTPERDPARAREAYPFRLDVRTRFGDLDTRSW